MNFKEQVKELKKLKSSNKFEVEMVDGNMSEVDVPRMTTNNAVDLFSVMAEIKDMNTDAQSLTFLRLVVQVVMKWTTEIDYITLESLGKLANYIVETETDFFGKMLGVDLKVSEVSAGDSSLTTSDSDLDGEQIKS